MGRMIDADRFLEYMEEKCDPKMQLDQIIFAIVSEALKEQKTAYDVDKVVEKLEDLQTYNMEFATLMSDLQKNGVYRHYICREDAIEIVKQEAAEYNNGWIPCSERLPETNESVLCWAKSTARGGDVCFVGSCHNGFWFLQSSADTHSFPGQYVIVAWKPIEPYQQKGEREA